VESAIAPLAFGCVFLLVLGLATVLRPRPVGRRLDHLASKTSASRASAAVTPSQSLVRSDETGLLGLFQRIGSRAEASEPGPFRQRFIHAGFSRPAAPTIFYGVRLSLAVGLPALAGLVPIVWGLSAFQQISLLGGLTTVGYLAPSFYLNSRGKRRKASITRTLPDALDLLVVCVEAGLGINQGLARVSQEFQTKSPALAIEFGLVGHETRAGKTTTEALRAMSDRVGVSDLSSLVALLVQTERFGTSVANALRVHADAMRIRRMQYAEERAQKATLKLILPSTMIFAALLLIFLAPGMYNFFQAFSGLPD
jgi:tight adherence protein C